jgi:endonuclease/exonuclease/phosphatase family metal-dependent hydrolase
VSWNVRALRDGRAGVVAVLRRLAPDVVVVQEAPRLVLWRTSRELLARQAGLRVASRGWGAGNLVLAAPHVRVLGSRQVLFPRRPQLHRRGVVLSELVVDGLRVTVAGTHLDLEPEARRDSAGRVRAALPPGPVVLGADVNEQPGGPAWDRLVAGLTDARDGLGPTFPAVEPRRWIDLVVTDLRVRSCEVVDVGAASDHRALLVELEA